jgi:hypothetical protein
MFILSGFLARAPGPPTLEPTLTTANDNIAARCSTHCSAFLYLRVFAPQDATQHGPQFSTLLETMPSVMSLLCEGVAGHTVHDQPVLDFLAAFTIPASLAGHTAHNHTILGALPIAPSSVITRQHARRD